jgi:xanthine dehydrogenase accessory factor
LDLTVHGIHLDDLRLSKIYCPVALDIVSENATESAVSIVSEIVTFLSGRSGSSLKLKNDTIHNRLVNTLHHE